MAEMSSARKMDMGLGWAKKDDMTSSSLATAGELNPDEGLITNDPKEKKTISAVADAMSMHIMGPNTSVVKMQGKRVGQVTKTQKDGKGAYIVSHDDKGEHPSTFSTKAGAKVGMAEMHAGETVKKVALPFNPLQSDPEKTDTMQEDPTVDALPIAPTPYADLLRINTTFAKRLTPQDWDPLRPVADLTNK